MVETEKCANVYTRVPTFLSYTKKGKEDWQLCMHTHDGEGKIKMCMRTNVAS